jgi:hypothetical protein
MVGHFFSTAREASANKRARELAFEVGASIGSALHGLLY